MLSAGLLLIMIIALCGVFVFPVSTLMGLLCVLVTGGTLAAYLLFLKKLPKYAGKIIEGVALAVGIVLMLAAGAKGQEHYLEDYSMRFSSTEWSITHQEKGAEKALKKLEKDFGENDAIKGLHALYCLLDDDQEGAEEYLDAYTMKTRDYYARKELYYIFDTENDTTSDLQRLYIDAAEAYPDWEYAQRMAGITQFDKQNFVSAGYYLASAMELDPSQPESMYYLGAIAFKQGDYETAMNYFQDSIDHGAGEEIRSWILWYLDQLEGDTDADLEDTNEEDEEE